MSTHKDEPPLRSDNLVTDLYDSLRRLAAAHLRHEPDGISLQPTALVHEAYLRLRKGADTAFQWDNDRHFFVSASRAMRRILIEHARTKKARKRGGHVARIHSMPLDDVPDQSTPEELLDLDRTLDRLSNEDPHKAQLVELKFFGGLTIGEIARVLEISESTVKRDWRFARAWLRKNLA